MQYDELRERVWKANLAIVEAGLVELTWGNASGADHRAGVMAIKPSGIDYDAMQPGDMVVLSLETGELIAGERKPSSDTPTHLVLYREFAGTEGVVHTHSIHAVSWAQAERGIPCLGTTHADHFHGEVPVTRRMTRDEIMNGYEHSTGLVIVERFVKAGIDPMHIPGALVACHGPFAWGSTIEKAVENAIVLESVARMATETLSINPDAREIDRALLDKHYFRKHGDSAYYGQD